MYLRSKSLAKQLLEFSHIKTFLRLIIIYFLVLGGVFPFLRSLTKPVKYNIASLLNENHPLILEYEEYKKHFADENQNYLLISTKDRSVLSNEKIKILLDHVDHYFRFATHLKSIFGLNSAEHLNFKDNQFFFQGFTNDQNILSAKGTTELHHPFWKNHLISTERDWLFFTFNYTENNTPEDIDYLLQYKSHLENQYPYLEVSILGVKVLQYLLLKEIQRSQNIVMPLLLLLLFLFMAICFRSLIANLLFFLILLLSYLATLLVVNLNEGGIGALSGFGLIFVLVVATSDLIHYFDFFFHSSQKNLHQRLLETKKSIFVPCFLTSLTTAVAFATLTLNDILPISSLGIYCTFGAMFCFVLTFYFLPLVIKFIDFNPSTKIRPRFNHLFLSWHKKILNYKKTIFAAFIVFSLINLFYFKNLEINDNMYEKFKNQHPFHQAIEKFKEKVGFLGSIDLLITPLTPKLAQNSKNQNLDEIIPIQKFENEVMKIPGVVNIRSFGQFFEYSQTLGVMDEKFNSFFSMLDRNKYLKQFYDSEKNQYKTVIQLSDLSSKDLKKMIEDIFTVYHQGGHKNFFDISVQGYAAIRNHIYSHLVTNLVVSFASTLVIIFIIFLVVFKSLPIALTSLIPNIVPIIFIGGVMGFLGLSIESDLTMVLCITFGIAVDDTIHFVYRFKKELQNSMNSFDDCLEKTMEKTGSALTTTTLTFMVSFPCFFLSNLKLFSQMGNLIIASLLIALISDLLLLPLLMSSRYIRNKV